MNEIFGVSMTAIMLVLAVAFGLCVAGVLAIYLSNRIMFRMGLRNVRRRRAQTILVVSGLMLATIIITAAFATGDSLDYSITTTTYENLQRTDLSLHDFRAVGMEATAPEGYAPEDTAARLAKTFEDDQDIEGFIPFLFEPLPVMNPRTRLSEPQVGVSGFDAATLTRFGGLRLRDGGHPDLAALGDDETLIGVTTADKLDARVGDVLTVYSQSGEVQLRVAGIVKDERAIGVLEFGTAPMAAMAVQRGTLQRITGHPGEINGVSVVLRGGIRGSLDRTDRAADKLEAFKNDRQAKMASGLSGIAFQVEKNKQDAVRAAELVGNVFTTAFIIMGLFSIAAGVLLIFMIFVMLAAERRQEMGIARAVGASRANLVQSFVAEGLVYDLVAGFAGIMLGLAAAFVLVVGGVRLVGGESFSFLQPYVSPRTLVVSFTLGGVLTFVTVALSSLRISQLNIVAAIRGTDERERMARVRGSIRWLWLAVGIPAMVVPPLGIYFVLRKGLRIPWGWIIGPFGILAGALFIWLGEAVDATFWITLGASLLPIGAGSIARSFGVRPRVAWTSAGAILALFWLEPGEVSQWIFGKHSGGMEMFVLSGIMIVAGLTMVIVYNARLLTTLFASRGTGVRRYRTALILAGLAVLTVVLGVLSGDALDGLGQLLFLVSGFLVVFAGLAIAAVRFPLFAPALKMGVAYPLANRFRTGMTLAMFSLVIFSITVMAILNGSFLQLFSSDEGRGGWDISAITNRNNPVPDIRQALAAEGSFDPTVITATGRMTFPREQQKVRQAGFAEWSDYQVMTVDDDYWNAAEVALEGRAEGYATDRTVFDAVHGNARLAIVDAMPLQDQSYNMGATGLFNVKGVKIVDHQFKPFEIEFRDAVTGKTETVQVIGVTSSKILPTVLFGLYVNAEAYTSVYGTPQFDRLFLRLAPGTDAKAAAKAIKAALVTKGVQATSLKQAIDDAMAQSRGFLRIFQAFMGLGLFVGIAALGVIALRSVVERRQQIGMLRAIGFQRGTVALSFMLENGFIALTGILSGVVGATILSWSIVRSDEMQSNQSVAFYVPWTEIVAYVVIAFVFALLMTWWPSRRAASVPIAEALRYE